jgi:hypothetical protein
MLMLRITGTCRACGNKFVLKIKFKFRTTLVKQNTILKHHLVELKNDI